MRRKKIWERVIPLSKSDRKWDIDFWQAQSSKARFYATWSLVVDFYRLKGKKVDENTLRLRRSVENIKQA
jgi:hypothetical protein